MQGDWDGLLERIDRWIGANEEIRGAAITGSRARADRPADDWSDLDLIVLTRDPSRLVDTTAWLDEIGPYWATVDHDAPIPGLRVRQVLFEGALDVDVVPVPAGGFADTVVLPGVGDLLAKGFRITADKDGELSSVTLPEVSAEGVDVTHRDFSWTIEDFLFQCVWATKHLCRGEVWMAKDDVDNYMKTRLLAMIEWHARLTGRNAATWAGASSGGRLLERWADPRWLDALPGTFAAYDARDVGRALLSLMELFRRVGEEVASQIGAPYPGDRHDMLREWVIATLEGCQDQS